WAAGELWLLDRRGDTLRRTATHSLPVSDVAMAGGAPRKDVAEEVRRHGKPVWRGEARGLNAYGLPIGLGEDLLGVFVFQGGGVRKRDAMLARTLRFVGVQFAQFVERKQVETQLRHQALHDGLTDLPNRTLFNDRLSHALAVSRRNASPLAVLLMDLDSFKE